MIEGEVLPAIVFKAVVSSGNMAGKRVPLLCVILHQERVSETQDQE